MAEYRDSYETIRAAGVHVAALAVDEPARSEALRHQLHLPFPILCDTRREVIQTWGLYNPREMGGIAKPAVFVLGHGRRVLFRSLDSEAARVPTQAVVNFLSVETKRLADSQPRRKVILPRIGDVIRSMHNALRFGLRSPRI